MYIGVLELSVLGLFGTSPAWGFFEVFHLFNILSASHQFSFGGLHPGAF